MMQVCHKMQSEMRKAFTVYNLIHLFPSLGNKFSIIKLKGFFFFLLGVWGDSSVIGCVLSIHMALCIFQQIPPPKKENQKFLALKFVRARKRFEMFPSLLCQAYFL